ncbi:CDK5 regulatory subunit-associated protein 3-like [Macrosteles quadrilineatus]|uniref:CDK5 regulatory subunit-associated protein 3-like n=1 Tax=Macrosteles quadrilineatus TaxID=74068 RepID=UPI0023E12368|nr:CDK5 regulatory subunit-associated protein 3-like [Macrosteles quadrilineatus]
MDQNIPIDINTNKLLDWLISRRIVNGEWQKSILPVREKINSAIQDMPQHPEIAQLLSGAYINYFHCIRIVEILKETEADSKNVFGRYGSQRMKDWQEVVRMYEKDNLYLAEAAHLLISNVKYEIPNLKKQVAKCHQNQQDCEKRAAEYVKNENSARNELNTTYKQLGLTGRNVKKELVDRLSKLPEIYQQVAENIASLRSALKYYSSFSQYVFDRETNVLPLLTFVSDRGNVTTYEWLFGEKPASVEEPPTPKFDDEPEAKEEEIDWGDVDNSVNYDIDYGITLEESGIEVECEESTAGVARGKNALLLLDNPDTREEVINQLLELESFLKIRLLEMQGESDLLVISQLNETTQSVTAMLDCVQLTKQLILDPATQHLHNIKHSLKYVDSLASSVEHKQGLVTKMAASQEAVMARGREAGAEAQDLQVKLKLVISKTKELQAQIEQDISKKYKNRPVNLMGGVTMI